MIPRDDCFAKIAELRGDAIVVSTYSSAFEWMRTQPSPLNFISVGAMGQASSHALGIALGLPDEKVILLDGDGSLLMNLGTLVTIAETAPGNLVHFVADNGCYEANGSHPTPGRDRVDFAAMARAAGYREAFEFDGLNSFSAALPAVLAMPGPIFATLKVETGAPLEYDYEYLHHADRRAEFRAALKPLIARRDAGA